MNEGIWFKSPQFKIQKNEDDNTNPGCYGKSLAEWLSLKFGEMGYDTEIIPEDWGWCVICERNGYVLWIGCGCLQEESFSEHYDNETLPDSRDICWHVFTTIEVSIFSFKTYLKNILGQIDTVGPLSKLDRELKEIIDNESSITICEEP